MLSTYLPLGLRKELLATPPAVPAGKARVQETALLYADLASSAASWTDCTPLAATWSSSPATP
jgi:hypothetical protein